MPDGNRISEPRFVESTERGWCQRLRLKVRLGMLKFWARNPAIPPSPRAAKLPMIQPITEPSDEPESLGSAERVLVTVGAATVEVTVAV